MMRNRALAVVAMGALAGSCATSRPIEAPLHPTQDVSFLLGCWKRIGDEKYPLWLQIGEREGEFGVMYQLAHITTDGVRSTGKIAADGSWFGGPPALLSWPSPQSSVQSARFAGKLGVPDGYVDGSVEFRRQGDRLEELRGYRGQSPSRTSYDLVSCKTLPPTPK